MPVMSKPQAPIATLGSGGACGAGAGSGDREQAATARARMATLEVRTREAGEFIVISCTNAGPELRGNALERAEPEMFLVRREFWHAKYGSTNSAGA